MVAVVATAGRPPPLPPPPWASLLPGLRAGNAQAVWVRPKPASLLSMPNCPAGVALDSRVLAPRRRLRLARGGEGVGLVARAPSCGGAQRSPQVGTQEMGDSPTQRGHTLSPNCAPPVLQEQILVGQLLLSCSFLNWFA